jgi:hypothetical protein
MMGDENNYREGKRKNGRVMINYGLCGREEMKRGTEWKKEAAGLVELGLMWFCDLVRRERIWV